MIKMQQLKSKLMNWLNSVLDTNEERIGERKESSEENIQTSDGEIRQKGDEKKKEREKHKERM